jgi:hypothetical protein
MGASSFDLRGNIQIDYLCKPLNFMHLAYITTVVQFPFG